MHPGQLLYVFDAICIHGGFWQQWASNPYSSVSSPKLSSPGAIFFSSRMTCDGIKEQRSRIYDMRRRQKGLIQKYLQKISNYVLIFKHILLYIICLHQNGEDFMMIEIQYWRARNNIWIFMRTSEKFSPSGQQKRLFKRAFNSAINPENEMCDKIYYRWVNKDISWNALINGRIFVNMKRKKNLLFSKDLQVFRSFVIRKALKLLHSDPETHLRF